MLRRLLIILVPLIVGYLIPSRYAALQLINRLLSWDRVSYSLYGNKPGVSTIPRQ